MVPTLKHHRFGCKECHHAGVSANIEVILYAGVPFLPCFQCQCLYHKDKLITVPHSIDCEWYESKKCSEGGAEDFQCPTLKTASVLL